MLSWIQDLVNLFYPEVCAACSNGLFKGESTICTNCLFHLPKTNFHLTEGNSVEKQFWGKVPVHSATALYYFNKGARVQQLIHRLKYHGEKEVGLLTGRILGRELIHSQRFATISQIVPVPLHSSKLRSRGYNQANFFGAGLSEAMKLPFVPDLLVREQATATQTHKSRYERFENVNRLFSLNRKHSLEPGHILLVDDVITTGSTLASCAATLTEVPGVKVSVATIAYARL
jgi:ComF family protein